MFPWTSREFIPGDHHTQAVFSPSRLEHSKDDQEWRGVPDQSVDSAGGNSSMCCRTTTTGTGHGRSSSLLSFVPLPALEERLRHEFLQELDERKRRRGVTEKGMREEQEERRWSQLRPCLVESAEEAGLYYPPMPSRGLMEALVGVKAREQMLLAEEEGRGGHLKRARGHQGEREEEKENEDDFHRRRHVPLLTSSSVSSSSSSSLASSPSSKNSYAVPFMSFAEGFQPVDYMGRLFVTPLPSAVERARARCREPCAPPRAPKRIFQSTMRGDGRQRAVADGGEEGEAGGAREASGPSLASRSSAERMGAENEVGADSGHGVGRRKPSPKGAMNAGIQMLRWAPPSFGHLFFSADLQGVTKLWRCHSSEWGSGSAGVGGGGDGGTSFSSSSSSSALLASYHAHRKPIKSLYVTSDATRMTSGSTDGTIAMWDIETGNCLHHLCTAPSTGGGAAYHGSRSTTSKSTLVGAFPPVVDHLHHPSGEPHLLLAAVDRKVVLYDVRTPSQRIYNDTESSGGWGTGGDGEGGEYCRYFKPQREYQGHMGTILHLSLLGSAGSKLLTTSEDKTLRTWDYSIPIQIKQFADAGMHAISHVLPHPREKECLVAQSLNNKVILFEDEGGGRLRLCPNREYAGHKVAGTRCQLGFSHDGAYLSSGDSTGELFIWKWDRSSTGKLVKKFKAHQGMLTTHLWHPMEPSRLITGGWDGSIKEWI